MNCPKCKTEWPINRNIVNVVCECYMDTDEKDYLYKRYMRAIKKGTAVSLASHKRIETPFGILVCVSVHPFGITVEMGDSRVGFPWSVTKDWQVAKS